MYSVLSQELHGKVWVGIISLLMVCKAKRLQYIIKGVTIEKRGGLMSEPMTLQIKWLRTGGGISKTSKKSSQ